MPAASFGKRILLLINCPCATLCPAVLYTCTNFKTYGDFNCTISFTGSGARERLFNRFKQSVFWSVGILHLDTLIVFSICPKHVTSSKNV